MQQRTFRAMGSEILAVVDNDDPHTAALLDKTSDWFIRWERQLSRFDPQSELSHLNRHQGEPVRVSETMWHLLEMALEAAHESDNLVTPFVCDALEAAGYQASFDTSQPRRPYRTTHTPSVYEPILRPIAYEETTTLPLLPPVADRLLLDTDTHTVCIPVGNRLDLGGIAKGWAATQAVQRLATCGPALVDAGGDIAISGPRQEGEPWLIGIADPRHPGEQLALLTLGECGVATSGQDYRYWEHHGSRQHHIIDPRTGYPALSDIITVTAIAPTLFQAEIAAKTVFLLGSYEGLSWLNRRPDLEGLVVCESGDVLRSNQFHRYLWS